MIATATGVYGNTEDEFFQKLLDEKITLFVDVRQRRGMRGRKYAFVNSNYLQNKLSELGIKYIHEKVLAPIDEIRVVQKKHDLISNQTKQARECLSDEFVSLYKEIILEKFDFQDFINRFNSEKIVFFCVEKNCLACHRSLIVNKLKEEYQQDGYFF
ncbi:DUF488 domain-containing protein [Conchiformibius steedae]|uniref:DUF488 domain-containing protein n=1 Tax=Conchiformibius steedae TaxID=153493 RepID=A0A3P2A8L1_9NEIS|nr:DUF488 domain-containing protein [Conchiformibius steedae]RRD89953.1 DUF488 domain-containing protein [Conchiformibius steedae]